MKTILALSVVFTLFYAQSQDYEKVITSGYSAQAIVHSNVNGIVMAGEYGTNVLIIRVDTNGAILWQQSVVFANNTSNFSQPVVYQIVPTSDSSFLITGESANPSENARNAFLIKCSANGSIDWTKQFYNGPDTECTHGSVIETPDSNYTWIWGDLDTGLGFSHTRLDASGTILSNTQFSWNESVDVSDIELLTDSTILVAGNMLYQNAASSRAGFLSEMTLNGTINWSKAYHDQYFQDILVNDSNLYVSGIYLDGTNQHMLSILDHSGNVTSLKNPDGRFSNDLDYHTQMIFNTDTSFIYYTSSYGDPGIATTLNNDGTLIETYETFMPGNDLMATGNGGALFLGTGPRQGIKCLFILEIGLVQKDSSLSSSTCFFPLNMQENTLINTPVDNIAFTAGTPSTEIFDMASSYPTQLYTEDRCVTQLSSLDELEASFINVYPNVSNGIFQFEVRLNETVTILIYSPDGNLIRSIENVQGEATVDLSDLANGSHYFKAISESGYTNDGMLILNK